jgi:GNAT superfamily N-acetyltransferase
MPIIVRELPFEWITAYARIPIRFEVHSMFDIELVDGGLGGILLHEVPVEPVYIKDYDASEEGGPEGWSKQFDTSNWCLLMAFSGEEAVGGAAVAFNTSGVHMLEERRDLAVLWDIRVQPEWRGHGVGKALFKAAEDWARRHACTQLKIETQNINVPACRFYHAVGARLGCIHRYGYAGVPAVAHEALLFWYVDLTFGEWS